MILDKSKTKHSHTVPGGRVIAMYLGNITGELTGVKVKYGLIYCTLSIITLIYLALLINFKTVRKSEAP